MNIEVDKEGLISLIAGSGSLCYSRFGEIKGYTHLMEDGSDRGGLLFNFNYDKLRKMSEEDLYKMYTANR